MLKINKKYILILVVIILGCLVFYFLWQNYQKPVLEEGQAEQKILDKQWQFPIIKNIASTLKKYDNLNFHSPDSDYLLWEKEGYWVYLPTNDSIYADYCGLPQAAFNSGIEQVFNLSPLGSVSRGVSEVFIDQGYLQDDSNSSKLEDESFIKGYQKDGVVCSIGVLEGTWPCGQNNQNHGVTMDIKCATGLDSWLAAQKPYIDLLVSLGALEEKTVAISYFKEKDGFLLVGVTNGADGASYILKDEGNKYSLIDGPLQEDPQCQKMKDWLVPQEIYGNCYDANIP